jgi:hypothetical protein
MNGIRRTSLAEFSRLYLYLRSFDAVPDKTEEPTKPTASPQGPENGFAAQVVLGMSKNCRDCLSEESNVRLIGWPSGEVSSKAKPNQA